MHVFYISIVRETILPLSSPTLERPLLYSSCYEDSRARSGGKAVYFLCKMLEEEPLQSDHSLAYKLLFHWHCTMVGVFRITQIIKIPT